MVGREEGMQLTLQIIRLYQAKNSLNIISKKVNKPIDFVEEILKEAGFIN